jgi:type IV pilus assembly protein PilV
MRMIIKQHGVGLIEVLVTVVITTVGLLGLSALQMQSIRSVSDSGNRTHAIWVANDIINRIRANQVASANYITEGEFVCPETAGAIKKCAAYFDGTNQQGPDANCSNLELALFDRQEALCGISSITGIDAASNSSSFINSPGLTISDAGNGDLEIGISWIARTSKTNSNDDTTTYYLDKDTTTKEQRETYSVVFRP